jgi:hypothetical protein
VEAKYKSRKNKGLVLAFFVFFSRYFGCLYLIFGRWRELWPTLSANLVARTQESSNAAKILVLSSLINR